MKKYLLRCWIIAVMYIAMTTGSDRNMAVISKWRIKRDTLPKPEKPLFKQHLCEGRCVCDKGFERINCTDVGITDLRDIAIPKSTTYLILDKNTISEIPSGILQKLPNLQMISIRNSNISKIEHQSLCSGNKLRYLILDANKLIELPEALFKDCSKLERLQLKNNFLIIEDFAKALPHMPRLQTLDISNSNFRNSSVLPPEFSILNNLRYFYLDEMEIHDLADGFFESIDKSNLRELSLMRNAIVKVANDSFDNMDNLELLDISYTNINVGTAREIFKSLSNSKLKTLLFKYIFIYMNSDVISDSDFFEDLHNTSLTVLHMEGNYGAFQGNLGKGVFAHIRHLEELYLDHNELKNIHHKAFNRLHKLRVLSLRRNYLSCLIDCSFTLSSDSFHSLEILDLSNNVIDDSSGLVTFTSESFPNLKFLNIRQNQLSAITVDTFNGLKHLKTLDISDNPINLIELGAFDGLIRLQSLLIENCFHIVSLPRHAFIGLKRLETLKLNGNGISSLETETFSDLISLLELDLSNNKIGGKKFPVVDVILPSSNLTSLNLSNNKLEIFPFKMLENKTMLKHVDLSYNRIRYFDENSFKHTNQIVSLDISYNNLLTLSETTFTEMDLLEQLHLAGNPYICDCKMASAKQWLTDHRSVLIDYDHITCSWPLESRDVHVALYNPPKEKCVSYIILTVTILATIIGFVVITAGYFMCRHRRDRIVKKRLKSTTSKQLYSNGLENSESQVAITSIETTESLNQISELPNGDHSQVNGNACSSRDQSESSLLSGIFSRKRNSSRNKKKNGFYKLEKEADIEIHENGFSEGQSTI